MTKILFVGNFLSKQFGSMPISEQIAKKLQEEGFQYRLCSNKDNQLLRLLDIFFTVTFSKYKVLHIDVFSGKAFYFAALASFLGKVRRKKVILTLHGGKLPEFHASKKKFVERVFSKSNVIQSPSKYLQTYFNSQSIPILYCPNPINLQNFPYKNPEFHNRKILWVRAFTSIYNPDIAVETVKHLILKYPDVTMTMVGPDKGLLHSIQLKIDELGLRDVIKITGSIPNNELQNYYHSHTVFLNTTSYESFGVAVVEAAACGIPIVSNPVGEIPFLYENNKEMLFIEEMNAIGFAQCVQRIFNDETLSNNLSINAFKKAEQFTWDSVRNHWLKIIEI